jgi:non-ribosomal peptide synthetase component F
MSSAISLTFGYAAELFERDTMERFATASPDAPRRRVAQPDARSASWRWRPPPTAARSSRGSRSRTPAARLDSHGGCIHEQFERQARRTPEAAAISFGSATLSYADLDAKANQLAQCLSAHGVGAETRVGLLADPSVETIVAMLAVLKAGGAYVPIDPGTPSLRLRELLDAVGGPVLLTQLACW